MNYSNKETVTILDIRNPESKGMILVNNFLKSIVLTFVFLGVSLLAVSLIVPVEVTEEVYVVTDGNFGKFDHNVNKVIISVSNAELERTVVGKKVKFKIPKREDRYLFYSDEGVVAYKVNDKENSSNSNLFVVDYEGNVASENMDRKAFLVVEHRLLIDFITNYFSRLLTRMFSSGTNAEKGKDK